MRGILLLTPKPGKIGDIYMSVHVESWQCKNYHGWKGKEKTVVVYLPPAIVSDTSYEVNNMVIGNEISYFFLPISLTFYVRCLITRALIISFLLTSISGSCIDDMETI